MKHPQFISRNGDQMLEYRQAIWYTGSGDFAMIEYMWSLLYSLTAQDVLFFVVALGIVALFSVLASRAEIRMWRAIARFNGERRALQRQITMGKSHLR
jgi:hypothetical protein